MQNGTEKQIAFAAKVKAERLAAVHDYNREAFARFAKFAAEKPERADESETAQANHERYAAWLAANDDACWWLDNQTTAQGLLKLARTALG